MNICNTEELRCKDIINLCDGSKLGYASDFEFDIDNGKILSIIINSHNGFFNIGKNDRIIIPWDKIECIGDDTVLVKVQISECGCRDISRKKWK